MLRGSETLLPFKAWEMSGTKNACPTYTSMAPSEIMRRIKGRTLSYLFEEFPHLKKRYWGQHFWARGYFCATVGQMKEEMIKDYLEHHFEPNPNDNFKMEPD
ncbi:transposase [Methylomicrobium album BG8]|uniref:Transposase n=1 Tax=Methylomicrobium album BG8 TaxID=686340 RepID=H8GL70_METAL|nr:transposase [Methylomicrobium album BG8]